ncbi:transmembrane channel-like protein 5 isoform X2 [Gymnodraco acuticeps]|uniref:Transmembrane channel-like protein n=1 Tax=Gymnodraco acuticeps TaxID=8218 RepID=A0A6P8VVR7_GYMAC|nr:transmembrane channel-like protein 5 isoform X2 [Gymnodraco acuticeps]
MTSYSNGGLFNPAYHDSETLEIDRRSSSKTPLHTNPYARGEGADGHYSTGQISSDDALRRVPRGGWQEESWRGRESLPMGHISTRPRSPSWQHDINHSTFQIPPDSQYDRSLSIRLPSTTSGNMTMRRRRISMRRMSMFPNGDPNHVAFTEDAIRNEMENEEQNLVKELVALSTRDRIWAIRDLPMSFDEKKHIRSQVLAFKSAKKSRQFTCFADCSENMSLGYFNNTVMYYGGYSNETKVHLVEYNMQLAYFFTIAVYMVLCGIALIFSMASSFKTNYVLADPASNSAWQLLCSWDFNITNDKAVRQRKNNLRVQLKESMSEKAQRERLSLSESLKHFGVYLGAWLLSTSLAVGSGASIYYLCQFEQQRATDSANWSLLQEAETLLVPFVVSLMNLVVPLFYSLFNKFEHYSSQRKQIYALVVRNVLLKMSILAVLCYNWMNVVAVKFSCWESMVGQALYRLVIVDFLFLMLGSFFGEFLSNVIGTRLLPRLGVPEFDVARNVLELIYAQTLAWIGIYFSPLLPAIQILKFFILFYLKKVSLTQNCQPPRRSGRAAQMQTIFIALLFFPFFVGAVSMVAFTAWSLTPSEHCGPFRGLNSTYNVVEVWMVHLKETSSSHWVVWIYQNVIRSEIFYFLISLIIIVIIYIFWQVTRGRKLRIRVLREQIVNEGKDKSFLLERLQNLQKSHPDKRSKQKNPKKHSKRRPDDHSSGGQSTSNAMIQALLARQQLEKEEEERLSTGGVPVPSDISSSSSALIQAMQARQRAEGQERNEHYSAGYYESPTNTSSAVTQAMQARQRAQVEGTYDASDPTSSVSSVMMQVMQARQRAEEEDRPQWVPAPPQNPAPAGSSALIQAMLARQQAQNEYDDGY